MNSYRTLFKEKKSVIMLSSPYFDWNAVRDFFSRHAECLMQAEQKESARMGFPPNCYTIHESGNRRFVSVMDLVFKIILSVDLPAATRQYPALFGTGNPDDVIEALYKVRSGYDHYSLNEYRDAIFNEKFCWLVEIDTNSKLPKDPMLRVDLSRGVSANQFRGGALHAFRHFALDGVPLSNNKDKNDIHTPLVVINLLIQCFFFNQLIPDKRPTDFVSFMSYSMRYKLKTVFYRNDNCGVFFVTTMHKLKR